MTAPNSLGIARVRLTADWTLGGDVGRGGGGVVVAAASATCPRAVAKFVAKAPGADRELLFVDLPAGVRHVIPILDSGDVEDHWVLVMPRADRSLKEHLRDRPGPLPLAEALPILRDVVVTLADLDGMVVHRDLKPANVLHHRGRWCLSDFGIARYAEATTAPDTQKHAMSQGYAAREQWLGERATAAADVYAFGVMAYEMLAGRPPFSGRSREDYREHHVHTPAPRLTGVPAPLAALVRRCMDKSPETRPTPTKILGQLTLAPPSSPGLGSLAAADADRAHREHEASSRMARGASEAGRRARLVTAARDRFEELSVRVREALRDRATTARLDDGDLRWRLLVPPVALSLIAPRPTAGSPPAGGGPTPLVVAHARIDLAVPPDGDGYAGRSHSLWFGDLGDGGFEWYECAFVYRDHPRVTSAVAPFALEPDRDGLAALAGGSRRYRLAEPPRELDYAGVDAFIDRWAGLLARAVAGSLRFP